MAATSIYSVLASLVSILKPQIKKGLKYAISKAPEAITYLDEKVEEFFSNAGEEETAYYSMQEKEGYKDEEIIDINEFNPEGF